MTAQADGDDGKELEEQVPIIELMRQCWLYGRNTRTPALEGDWAQWWADHGSALMEGYYGTTMYDAYDATQADIHRLVTANHAALQVMLEAMKEFEPDDVLDEDGDVWTITAETDTGTRLHRTVRSLALKPALAAATLAWGHGSWESLRNRRAVVED